MIPSRSIDPTSRSVQSIGPHKYQFERDLLLWRPCGELLLEHSQHLDTLIKDCHRQNGYLLFLFDGREATPLSPDARRTAVDCFRGLSGTVAVAAFNTALLVRTAAFLVLNAARLLSGIDLPHKFTDHESEARLFLETCRPKLQARARSRA